MASKRYWKIRSKLVETAMTILVSNTGIMTVTVFDGDSHEFLDRKLFACKRYPAAFIPFVDQINPGELVVVTWSDVESGSRYDGLFVF